MTNRNIIVFALVGGAILSAYSILFPTSPTSLGKEVCECYKTARSYTNPDKKLRKVEYCGSLMQDNLNTLHQRGIDKDWSFEEVKNAQNEFDKALEACK